jgi:hypothetical protein
MSDLRDLLIFILPRLISLIEHLLGHLHELLEQQRLQEVTTGTERTLSATATQAEGSPAQYENATLDHLIHQFQHELSEGIITAFHPDATQTSDTTGTAINTPTHTRPVTPTPRTPTSPSAYRGKNAISNTELRREIQLTKKCGHYCHAASRSYLPSCPVCLETPPTRH